MFFLSGGEYRGSAVCAVTACLLSVFFDTGFIFLLILNKSVIIHLDGLKQNRISILRSSETAQYNINNKDLYEHNKTMENYLHSRSGRE